MEPPLVPPSPASKPPPAGCLALVNRAGRLASIDGNGVERVMAVVDDNECYDGEPTNYVAEIAATPMTATYSADTGKTILLTAVVAGIQDPAPELDIVAPVATSEGANAELAIVSETDGVVTVQPGTGAGAKATSTIAASGDDMAMRVKTAGVGGDEVTIVSELLTQDNPVHGVYAPVPSRPAVTVDSTYAPVYRVHPATGAGTAGVLTLTESLDGNDGEITITQADAHVGEWANTHVKARVQLGSGVSQELAAVATVTGGNLEVVITLPTTAEGLPTTATAAAVQDAVQVALDVEFEDVFVVASTVVSDTFISDNEWVAMSGAVNPAIDTTPVAVADFELLLTGATASDLEVATVGTGNWVPEVATYTFTGGGANSAITSKLSELATLLASSTVMHGVVGEGDGETVITDSTTTLTGGSDLVPAVPGTPGKRGRHATDGTDVWTALVEDQTTTQAGWVKTFTGGA